MKQFAFTLLVLLLSCNVFSQQRVGMVEGEIALGLLGGVGHDSFATSQSGLVSAEMRVNLPHTPFSVGLQLAIAKYSRDGWKNYRHEHTTLYTDYNYRPHNNLNLFAGVGLGYGETVRSAADHTPENSFDEYRRHFVVSPRIGAELFNVLRLTFESKIISHEYTYFGATLGISLGGRCK